MTPDRHSLVSLLEAAYRPSLQPDEWLDQIARAALAFDQGLGVFAALERFGADPAGPREHLGYRALGNPALAHLLERVEVHSGPLAVPFATRMVMVGSLRDLAPKDAKDALTGFFGALAPLGIEDLWGIGATDPGTGLSLALCWPTRRVSEPEGFSYWARTGVHLAAGVRLRGVFLRDGGLAPAAVLTPEGRFLHADGELASHRGLRERLQSGVRAIERARGEERQDATRALTLWQALTAGRYSLVDRLESDGRRFVLALPNEVGADEHAGLSPREQAVVRWVLDGASNKVAAYALGLTLGGFSAQLARAMRKLRVKNRTELKLLARHSEALPLDRADETSHRFGYAALPLGSEDSGATPSTALGPLSSGQRALLGLVAEGLSNQEIARRLQISPHTVRNRLARLSQRLGGRTRSELAELFAGVPSRLTEHPR